MSLESATRRLRGIGRVQRLLALRTFAPFAELQPEELLAVAEYTRGRVYPKDTYVFREGEPPAAVQFLVDGSVSLLRGGRRLRTLGPRTVVGGLGVFAQDVEGYDCLTDDHTVALEISAEDMYDILEDHFPLLRAALRGMSGEILEARRSAGASAGFGEPTGPSPSCPARPLDLVERMAFLRKTMPFASSELEAIVDLAREVEELRCGPDVTLWKEDDGASHVVFPICGHIRCVSRETGQRFRFGPGDSVGGLDAMAEKPRWFTAETEEEVVALRLDTETLYDVFEDHCEMAMDFLRVLARGLLRLYEQTAED